MSNIGAERKLFNCGLQKQRARRENWNNFKEYTPSLNN